MCWGVTLDLMLACPLLREHVSTGKVSVGINHEMSDFRNKKKKNLDLVLCRSTESGTFGGSKSGKQAARTFAELAPIYGIALTDHERSLLDTLPPLKIGKVSSVLLAVEAKAAMTAFHKARPRLKDELTSSHQTIHGDTDEAIAAGLVMVNTASEFVSPDMNKFTHRRDQYARLIQRAAEVRTSCGRRPARASEAFETRRRRLRWDRRDTA